MTCHVVTCGKPFAVVLRNWAHSVSIKSNHITAPVRSCPAKISGQRSVSRFLRSGLIFFIVSFGSGLFLPNRVDASSEQGIIDDCLIACRVETTNLNVDCRPCPFDQSRLGKHQRELPADLAQKHTLDRDRLDALAPIPLAALATDRVSAIKERFARDGAA